MAGSISLSLSQQFDELGEPLSGGTLQFYAAGTTTPQSAYQDTALTLPYSNPIILDSAGRIPAFYLADGQIKIRLSNAAGVVQVAADNLLVIGASSGTASPPSVDATTVFSTGDIKARYGTGTHSGWVRVNGRTIGSATSGATERANADCEDLFLYLYGADTNLSVSGGRGASAAADWAANKTIALPDARSRTLAGLGDMGNSDNALFSGASFTFGTSTTLGALIGAARRSLGLSNLPAYTPSGTVTLAASGGGAATKFFRSLAGVVVSASGDGGGADIDGAQAGTGSLETITASFAGTAQGGTAASFDTVSPYILLTLYVKL